MMNPWPLLVAVGVTLLNAAKPVCVDDAYYLRLARDIARHPALPYGEPPDGFETIWGDLPTGAFHVLAPPVLPYYLAAGIAVLGDDPFLLKLSLLPFVLLFAQAVYSLSRRFAPGRERELLFAVCFSAAVLPCWNLMLDLHAEALGLAAFARFGDGLDSGRWSRFVVAGFLLGLAFETKYNAVGFFALIAIWGCSQRRFVGTAICLGVTVGLVVAWEWSVSYLYGESHFLHHAFRRFEPSPTHEKRSHLILPLIGIFGAMTPFLVCFLFPTNRRLPLIGILVLAPVFFLPHGGYAGILFVTIGLSNLLAVGWTISRRPRSILTVWLGIEIGIAFLMSPFCAARRVVGIVVAVTFVMLSSRPGERGRVSAPSLETSTIPTWGDVSTPLAIVIWGLLLFTVDLLDCRVEIDAVREIARDYRAETVWFRGHWGFADEAYRSGWRVVLPGRSVLKPGELLVYPEPGDRPAGQKFELPRNCLEQLETRHFGSLLPIRTVPDWYGGKLPFRHFDGDRLTVTIFRVREPFRAVPPGEAVTTEPTRGETLPKN